MFKYLYKKFRLYFNPIKPGEVYYGNPKNFIVGKPMEYILHGLKDTTGTTMWHPIPSDCCYKLTIKNHSPEKDLYECESEVLCDTEKGLHLVDWHRRSQRKNISKPIFEYFILNGLLERGNK